MKQQHEYLIVIDSDGTAFDTMEIKHKECFIPNIIQHWQLHGIQRQVRQAAEFVNLYSHWRGLNRFPALIKLFDLLNKWPEVQEYHASIPQVPALREWISVTGRLDNHSLKKQYEKTGAEELAQAWRWSEAVNRSVAERIQGVPPFPSVRACLEKISKWADVVVCSVTADEELAREWEEHDLRRYVSCIAGQSNGTKSEIIRFISAGVYAAEKILMIGDSPVDENAASENKACFFPIQPGKEEQSWQLFFKVADQFRQGRYANGYMSHLVEKFHMALPMTPTWEKSIVF